MVTRDSPTAREDAPLTAMENEENPNIVKAHVAAIPKPDMPLAYNSPKDNKIKPAESEDSGLDSDDVDKYRLEVDPERPAKQPSEKRRIDDAAYHTWLDGRQSREQEEAFRQTDASEKTNELPTRLDLYNNAIICSPREYQTALFERSKEKNIIVVLDTGRYQVQSQDTDCLFLYI